MVKRNLQVESSLSDLVLHFWQEETYLPFTQLYKQRPTFQQTKKLIGLLNCFLFFSPFDSVALKIMRKRKSARMLSRFTTLARFIQTNNTKCNTLASGSEYVNIYPILAAEHIT